MAPLVGVVLLGALPGCRSWLDGVAQVTGTGTDPEGVVHAFLWARREGKDTARFWRAPVGYQPPAADPIVGRPVSWRVLPRANPSDGWRWIFQTWKRFVVTSRLSDGRIEERAWDFCLASILDHEPRYVFLEAWPAAADTFARCSAARSSDRYGREHAGEAVHDAATAGRIRARGQRLAGRDVTPTNECVFACGEDGTDRDCDLCVCAQERLATPACDAAKALDL